LTAVLQQKGRRLYRQVVVQVVAVAPMVGNMLCSLNFGTHL
jgi:hypothetical protein